MSSFKRHLPTCNIILSILCILMLVCQFLPFWNDGETVCSMQGMLWFPNNQNHLPDYIGASTGETFNIDSVVWLTLLTFVCVVLGAIFSIVKRYSAWPAIFPVVGGFSAIWNYLTRPELQLGSLWGLHLAVGILLFVIAAVVLVRSYIDYRHE